MSDEAMVLPAWKSCLEAMWEQGITHGKVFSVQFFEKELRSKRDEPRFGFDISLIRRELEHDGMYLNGYGLGGESYQILLPKENADVGINMLRRAFDLKRRTVILLGSTPVESLSPEEKHRLDHVLRKAALQLALCKRPAQVAKALKGKDQKLLE